MKTLTLSAVACLLVTGLAVAADIKSGLSEGEIPPAFNVRDITGPNAGQTLCYRCAYSGRPTVAIFTRDVNDSVSDLVSKIDAQVGDTADSDKLAAFVVVLTDNEDATKAKLLALAKDKKIKNVPLTVMDGNGPAKYRIAKDADVTVLMWSGKVRVNHAYGKGEFDDKAVEACAKDTKKILD